MLVQNSSPPCSTRDPAPSSRPRRPRPAPPRHAQCWWWRRTLKRALASAAAQNPPSAQQVEAAGSGWRPGAGIVLASLGQRRQRPDISARQSPASEHAAGAHSAHSAEEKEAERRQRRRRARPAEAAEATPGAGPLLRRLLGESPRSAYRQPASSLWRPCAAFSFAILGGRPG